MTETMETPAAKPEAAAKGTHRFAFSIFHADGTGVPAENFELFDRSPISPEENARAARDSYAFEDFLNDPARAIGSNEPFRLFKRGNRLLAVEKVQQGWWESRYFAPRRVRRRKPDDQQGPVLTGSTAEYVD